MMDGPGFGAPAELPSRPFRNDVLNGLSKPQKTIPAKYFYDTTGSLLFEEITQVPEYYPTRTEIGILTEHADEIARLIGPEAVVIELGAGANRKIRILLDALERPAAFVPIDIAGDHLYAAAEALAADYPGLNVIPVAGDYTQHLDLPVDGALAAAKRVAFYPGSTIGNFTPDEARAFLAKTCRLVRPGGELVVGADLQKDPAILRAAYNDARGVTAAFNLNLLKRMNRELGADFDLSAFEHDAIYDTTHHRVEMHLVSRKRQTVTLAGRSFDLAQGETIHTENSYKFTVAGFQRLATDAGFEPVHVWTDRDNLFSLHYLRAA